MITMTKIKQNPKTTTVISTVKQIKSNFKLKTQTKNQKQRKIRANCPISFHFKANNLSLALFFYLFDDKRQMIEDKTITF